MHPDQMQLHFNPESLTLLNVILGLVMFGVALDLHIRDFKRLFLAPKGPLIGLTAQFLLLPMFTYLLIRIIEPMPSLALGMILVAACPGGNVSNFITHLAGGNTALSVTMTAISTTLALVMTPFNLTFWGSLYPPTAELLTQVQLDPVQVFFTIVMILGIPLAAGMSLRHYAPKIAARLRRPFKIASIGVFVLFIAIAFMMNFDNFQTFIVHVFYIVFLHNATALLLGFWSSRLLGMPHRDARAVSIEVGIQNSGLGLVLIFDFFHGLGGMALVAAWWGIWHLVAGLSLATYWSRKPAAAPALSRIETTS